MKRLFMMATLMLLMNSTLHANQATLIKAEQALSNQDFGLAKRLFGDLTADKKLNTKALFGLAKVALYQDELDQAQDLIEQLLDANASNPEHLFIAGRIAGAQAKSASIFTKLGYARDAKAYFTQALQLDSSYTPALIGLIRFHQQAPVMAGGDKDAIEDLVQQLATLDKRAAFAYQLPKLLEHEHIEQAFTLYRAALEAPSAIDANQFRFDFAMQLSYQGLYEPALQELLAIELPNDVKQPDFAAMRHYQIGKMAAESRTHLDIGIQHMRHYAALPAAKRTIDQQWVDFRLAQLQFLKQGTSAPVQDLEMLLASATDEDLRDKVSAFLTEHKL